MPLPPHGNGLAQLPYGHFAPKTLLVILGRFFQL